MLFVVKFSKILTKTNIFIKMHFHTIEIFAKKNLTNSSGIVRFFFSGNVFL